MALFLIYFCLTLHPNNLVNPFNAFEIMYAIVEIGGQQFKISKDQKIYVNLVQNEEGSELEFDQVLLLAEGEKIQVGKPLVQGARVKATVLAHVKADKVLVFKKKRRKGYQKMNGHRQPLTQIQIQEIIA